MPSSWPVAFSMIGAPGSTGATGATGLGVPSGGSAGQVLAKASATDYQTQWITVSGSGSGSTGATGATGASVILGIPTETSNTNNTYIDTETGNLYSYTTGIITTIAGIGTEQYYSTDYGEDSPAISAQLRNPSGVAVDVSGNVYIADTNNHTIRKIDTSGIITTVAGTKMTLGYTGDGGEATLARLSNPCGVAVDVSGNIYIADTLNNKIRKVNSSTGIITTIASSLNSPRSVAIDISGNVYIADQGNYIIRKINASTGNIITIAGTGTQGTFGTADGPATSANLHQELYVAVDISGNVYISESSFSRPSNSRILKVNAQTQMITTIAGTGPDEYFGDGGLAINAKFHRPQGIAVDRFGNLYIADMGNSKIRKINASTGIITSVAGVLYTGLYDDNGDGGLAIYARLTLPIGVAVDSSGDIYIADSQMGTIRKVTLSSTAWHILKNITGPTGPTGDSGVGTALTENFMVAAGVNTNKLAYSYNGTVWYSSSSGNAVFSELCITVAWNGSVWVAGGEGTNTLAYSSDGINWTGLGNSIFTICSSVAWNGSSWLASGGGTGTTNQLAVSDDGINWTSSIADTSYSSLVWNGSLWVGASGTLSYSNDGITWDSSTSGTTVFTDAANSVAWNGSLWIAGGGGTTNTLARSDDGIIWTGLSTTIFTVSCRSVAWNGSLWVAGGSGTNRLASSIDGITWTPSVSGNSMFIDICSTVAWNGSVWIAGGVGTTNTLAYSVDGNTWTPLGKSIFDLGSTTLVSRRPLPYVGYTYAKAAEGAGSTGATGPGIDFKGEAGAILFYDGVGITGDSNTAKINSNNINFLSNNISILAANVTIGNGFPGPSASGFDFSGDSCKILGNEGLNITGGTLKALGITDFNGLTGTANQVLSAGPNGGSLVWQTPTVGSGSGSSAAGPAGAIQYKDTNSSLAGSSNLTYDGLNKISSGDNYIEMNDATGVMTLNAVGGIVINGSPILKAQAIEIVGTFSLDGSLNDYTNSSGADGQFLGRDSTGKLAWQTPASGSGSTSGQTGATGMGISSLYVNAAGDLNVVYTNTNNYNIGRVLGATGATGPAGSGSGSSVILGIPGTTSNTNNIYLDKVSGNIYTYGEAPPNITTIAGVGKAGYFGDGNEAISSEINTPSGIAIDLTGNLYIADTDNNRIRKVDNLGIITTIAGTGVAGYSGDNGLATLAELNKPGGVALDSSGNIYIADTENYRIRKIIGSTGIITTIAGTGLEGYSANNVLATSAALNLPYGISIDISGNIYIADTWNHRICKINASTGNITTIAGTGEDGYSLNNDGLSATSAALSVPYGVAVDISGNIYISERDNNKIRKVNAQTQLITTIDSGVSGPSGIAIDISGNIYIADTYNNRIRKINGSTGVITTIAGTGAAGYSGDGSLAISATLASPERVAIDLAGNIYIADTGNYRIRKIISVTGWQITGSVSGSSAAGPDGAIQYKDTNSSLAGSSNLIHDGNSKISSGNNYIEFNDGTDVMTLNAVGGIVINGSPILKAQAIEIVGTFSLDGPLNDHTNSSGTDAQFLGNNAGKIEWQTPESAYITYTPGNSAHWTAPAPTTIGSAIDRLAAAVAGLIGTGTLP